MHWSTYHFFVCIFDIHGVTEWNLFPSFEQNTWERNVYKLYATQLVDYHSIGIIGTHLQHGRRKLMLTLATARNCVPGTMLLSWRPWAFVASFTWISVWHMDAIFPMKTKWKEVTHPVKSKFHKVTQWNFLFIAFSLVKIQ